MCTGKLVYYAHTVRKLLQSPTVELEPAPGDDVARVAVTRQAALLEITEHEISYDDFRHVFARTVAKVQVHPVLVAGGRVAVERRALGHDRYCSKYPSMEFNTFANSCFSC